MRRSWRSRIIGLTVWAAACTCGGPAWAAVVLSLTNPQTTVAPGDSFFVQAEITVPDTSFNAFELIVRYDPAMVTFLPSAPVSSQIGSLMTNACANEFHIFNAYPDSTVADVSMLCNQTFVSGPGPIYRLKFKANAVSGMTQFPVGSGTRFYRAGIIVPEVVTQGLTIHIGGPLAVPGPREGGHGYVLEAPRPNPLLPGESASVAFSLPGPARVKLELFDVQGRTAATRDVGDSPAGRSLVRWAVPGLPAGRYELRLVADGRLVGRRAWVVLR